MQEIGQKTRNGGADKILDQNSMVECRYLKMKRMVHTGPNIQFGGLKKGLVIEGYHVFTDFVVANEPKLPARSVRRIEAISFNTSVKFAFFIIFI